MVARNGFKMVGSFIHITFVTLNCHIPKYEPNVI